MAKTVKEIKQEIKKDIKELVKSFEEYSKEGFQLTEIVKLTSEILRTLLPAGLSVQIQTRTIVIKVEH